MLILIFDEDDHKLDSVSLCTWLDLRGQLSTYIDFLCPWQILLNNQSDWETRVRCSPCLGHGIFAPNPCISHTTCCPGDKQVLTEHVRSICGVHWRPIYHSCGLQLCSDHTWEGSSLISKNWNKKNTLTTDSVLSTEIHHTAISTTDYIDKSECDWFA